MSELFSKLLISCPNGGGVFLAHAGQLFKLDGVDTTGLYALPNALLRAAQPSSLWICGDRPFKATSEEVLFPDIHDVLGFDGFYYLVGTTKNEVVKLDLDGREVQRWVYPGADDSRHLNCLGVWNKRVVFSAFGDFKEARGYKGNTTGSGYVQDLLSGDRLIKGLSQPHSLVPYGENLLVASSEDKELREYTLSGDLVRSVRLDGYSRGVCVVGSVIYVGLSRSRNIDDAGVASATVLALDADSLAELGRISLPANEVYSIIAIEDASELISAIASTVSISSDLREGETLELKGEILELKRELTVQVGLNNERVVALNESVENSKYEIELLREGIRQKSFELSVIYNSKSWLLTKPLRFLMRCWVSRRGAKGLRENLKALGHFPRNLSRLSNAVAHVRTHGLASALRRAREVLTGAPTVHSMMPVACFDLHGHEQVYVLCTRHCLFIAELITRQLKKVGIKCAVIFEKPIDGFSNVPHFVVCPQMFTELPELYVAFQMEQTVSSRWLTPEYLRVLEGSFAVFDYSLNNLAYFSEHGVSQKQLSYMPISWLPDYYTDVSGCKLKKEYDVLFYGDANNERRRQFIARIEEKYKVKLIDNLFGEELYRELRKARVVINVHYYEGALLETTRLYECLSLGCLVVSESSSDIEQHQQLSEVVDFVEVGDADSMLGRLDYWLADEHAREARLTDNIEILRRQPNEFEYFFQRFLLASGNINFDRFYSLAADNIRFSGNFLCLGLPESVERRADFDKDNVYGIQYFPGLRHPLGWIGCGMSYKFIMRKAAEQDLPWIIVCEDDVEFTPGWEERLSKILTYLQAHPNDWDIFSGFIADLHEDTQVVSIAEQDGLEFVHIDKMVSAVFNVYNASFYQAILKWDESNHDVHGNAIDRYMENHVGIRVVTIHPFLVGHKEEQKSTLWGFENSFYNDMIDKSNAVLESKIETYRRKGAGYQVMNS